MPALPTWYARIPDILASLESAPPFLDRPAFEHLFGLGRRQAIRLMGSSGGYQVGKTFLVDRDSLAAFLKRLRSEPEVRRAVQRKYRILSGLRDRIVLPPPAPPSAPSLLPACPGVSKPGPGRIEIQYGSAADLLGKIAALATAAAEDFPAFRETFE